MAAERLPIVYIVDDEKVNRFILQRSFEEEKVIIRDFGSGAQVLEMLQREKPDIILLDVMMPVMDGYEVCRLIKENPLYQDILIIFITANNDREARHFGLSLGAVDYIGKPLDVQEIRLRVMQQIKMRQMYLELENYNKKMRRDIKAAQQIQQSLLPENFQKLSQDMDFYYLYHPCETLGGDFLDIFKVGEYSYLFYLADVSGHGVASALITMFVKEFFHRFRNQPEKEFNPAKMLFNLNKTVLSLNFSERYLTIFAGIINTLEATVTWSSAGPNTKPAIISSERCEFLENKSLPIGWFAEAEWQNYTTLIPKDSMLLLYSDAAIEVKEENGEILGIYGFAKMAQDVDIYHEPNFIKLKDKLLDFSGLKTLEDDLTLVAVKR